MWHGLGFFGKFQQYDTIGFVDINVVQSSRTLDGGFSKSPKKKREKK
jgi:hypothetical protein